MFSEVIVTHTLPHARLLMTEVVPVDIEINAAQADQPLSA